MIVFCVISNKKQNRCTVHVMKEPVTFYPPLRLIYYTTTAQETCYNINPMQKIKEIYKKTVSYIKNLNFTQVNKKYIGLVGLILVLAIVGYQIFNIQSQTDKSELVSTLDEAIEQIKAAKENKDQYTQKKIYEADYNAREAEIEIKAEEIAQKLHSMKLEENIKVDKATMESIGDSLQILLYVMHNSTDLKNLNDEILALSIIIEEVKTQI